MRSSSSRPGTRCRGNGLGLVNCHRLQIAPRGPADNIAPHLPNPPPSARGVQEFHLVFEVEGGDLRCRHAGAIPEGQVVDVHKVQGW